MQQTTETTHQAKWRFGFAILLALAAAGVLGYSVIYSQRSANWQPGEADVRRDLRGSWNAFQSNDVVRLYTFLAPATQDRCDRQDLADALEDAYATYGDSIRRARLEISDVIMGYGLADYIVRVVLDGRNLIGPEWRVARWEGVRWVQMFPEGDETSCLQVPGL